MHVNMRLLLLFNLGTFAFSETPEGLCGIAGQLAQ